MKTIYQNIFFILLVYLLFFNCSLLQKLTSTGVQLKHQEFTINSNTENTITGNGGTKITIPKNVFVDSKGKYISDKVTVKLIEVFNSVDLAFSGIEMIYKDKDGTVYQFESAGMFKLTAKSNNEKLSLAKGSKINVLFPNIVPGDRFNVYKLNSKGDWIYNGHNQESSDADTNEKIRKYSIDALTWWNYDFPHRYWACLKGKIITKNNTTLSEIKIRIIGADKIYADKGILVNSSFKINAIKFSKAKILIIHGDKLLGVSKIISVWDKTGNKNSIESSINEIQDIGEIKLFNEAIVINSTKELAKKLDVNLKSYDKGQANTRRARSQMDSMRPKIRKMKINSKQLKK